MFKQLNKHYFNKITLNKKNFSNKIPVVDIHSHFLPYSWPDFSKVIFSFVSF